MKRKLTYREALRSLPEMKLYKQQASEPFKLAHEETPDIDRTIRERLERAADRQACAARQVTFNFWSV